MVCYNNTTAERSCRRSDTVAARGAWRCRGRTLTAEAAARRSRRHCPRARNKTRRSKACWRHFGTLFVLPRTASRTVRGRHLRASRGAPCHSALESPLAPGRRGRAPGPGAVPARPGAGSAWPRPRAAAGAIQDGGPAATRVKRPAPRTRRRA